MMSLLVFIFILKKMSLLGFVCEFGGEGKERLEERKKKGRSK